MTQMNQFIQSTKATQTPQAMLPIHTTLRPTPHLVDFVTPVNKAPTL